MPDHEWKCRHCAEQNPAFTEVCRQCNQPAEADDYNRKCVVCGKVFSSKEGSCPHCLQQTQIEFADTITPAKLAPLCQVLRSAFSLYRSSLSQFIWPSLVLFGCFSLISLPDTEVAQSAYRSLGIQILEETILSTIVLSTMLHQRFPGLRISLSLGLLARLLFTYVFAAVAFALGIFLLVLPGLWALAAMFLSPIFVLGHKLWPIEAISASAAISRGNLINILGLIFMCWIAIGAITYLADFLSQPFSYIANLAIFISRLYYYAIVVVVFADLNPCPQFKP